MNEMELLKDRSGTSEEAHSAEKALLLRIIRTYGKVVETHPEFANQAARIVESLNEEGFSSPGVIDEAITELRREIFSREARGDFENDPVEKARESLVTACRIINNIMISMTEDFYPLTESLKKRAEKMTLEYGPETTRSQLQKAADAFFTFLASLKQNISDDFRQIHDTVQELFGQMRELEATIGEEFGEKTRRAEMETFEAEVSDQVGSIVGSINPQNSIEEIRAAVVEKLTRIKSLIAIRKEKEIKKAKTTQQKIEGLTKKVAATEEHLRVLYQNSEKLRKAAFSDGLTMLYNRNALDEKLRRTFNSVAGTGNSFSLVLLDVDNFKWINDTFGHVAGDKVLKEISNTLKESFRKNDFIARYGGDEFAVVVEDIDREIAEARVDLFQENFNKKRFISHMLNKNIQIDISAGIAVAKEGDTIETLIHRADRAMYDIKKLKHR